MNDFKTTYAQAGGAASSGSGVRYGRRGQLPLKRGCGGGGRGRKKRKRMCLGDGEEGGGVE